MSPNDQRISIAQTLGWVDIETLAEGFDKRRWQFYTNDQNGYPDDDYEVGDLVGRYNPKASLGKVPDYLNDLNDVHEAEQRLFKTEASMRLYIDHLVSVLKPGEFTVCAPVAKRAEAILRTIGKWTP